MSSVTVIFTFSSVPNASIEVVVSGANYWGEIILIVANEYAGAFV